VLADNIRSLWNIGSLFRTADACGVERLVLTGICGCPPRPEIAKTALGAERAVPWRYEADALRAAETIREQGYRLVALEFAAGSIALERFRWHPPVCLIIGNEVAGISPPLLERCHDLVHIPMHGVKTSLNVAVAFGIAGHRAARSLLESEKGSTTAEDRRG
jgi:tRNA G18 (ribose-2'-O)-methylase SpoU